jgi:hypothetical protein
MHCDDMTISFSARILHPFARNAGIHSIFNSSNIKPSGQENQFGGFPGTGTIL